MTAPDRIWAWPWAGETARGQWSVMAYGYGMTTEYIRADLATPAAMDVPFTTCDTHVAVIGTGQHSFVAEPVFTVSDALDVPKVKALVEAAEGLLQAHESGWKDKEDWGASDRMRAALAALREGGAT